MIDSDIDALRESPFCSIPPAVDLVLTGLLALLRALLTP